MANSDPPVLPLSESASWLQWATEHGPAWGPTFYAVRHKPSGGFLPVIPRRWRDGHTHLEPCTDSPPRLHSTKIGAQRALAQWLKGPLVRNYKPDRFGDVLAEAGYRHMPVPSRIPADMEIVTIRLEVSPA